MNLSVVVESLKKLAPLKLASGWDNVGLLVEPSAPHVVKHILLTNDLTEGVMDESISNKADLIISYHPPVFRPLKRITLQDWKQRLVIKALENRIAIYSPHTACDAVKNGVNDWLATGLGELKSCGPITNSTVEASLNRLLKIDVSRSNSSTLLEKLRGKFGHVREVQKGDNTVEIQLQCCESDVSNILNENHCNVDDLQLLALCPIPLPNTGIGRLCHLANATRIADLIDKLKTHLSIPHVRLALAYNCSITSEVQTVALCAGSGSSVLNGVKADLYLTGEMSHHDVLDAVSNGVSVILCEHSNTERGYLYKLKEMLHDELKSKDVEITVSTVDRDPLEVY